MRENTGRIRWRVNDVVSEHAAEGYGRIQSSQVANALGDLMIGAGRVAADSQTSDDLAVLVQRHTSAEEDQPAGDLAFASIAATWRRERLWIEQIGLAEAPERVARLREGVEASRGQSEGVEAERVPGVCLRLGNRLTARPYLRRVGRRGVERADLPSPVNHRRPHARALEDPTYSPAVRRQCR